MLWAIFTPIFIHMHNVITCSSSSCRPSMNVKAAQNALKRGSSCDTNVVAAVTNVEVLRLTSHVQDTPT